MALDKASLVVLCVGGLAVLLSYAWAFSDVKGGYACACNPYWLGYSSPLIQALVILQLLAVLGFFGFVVPWVFIEAPKGGLLSHAAALPVVLGAFLAAATLWGPAMRMAVRTDSASQSRTWKWVGAGALWVCAIASILFVAGAVEEDNPRWYLVLGAMCFALTTVLGDGVAYPARMLTRDIRAPL